MVNRDIIFHFVFFIRNLKMQFKPKLQWLFVVYLNQPIDWTPGGAIRGDIISLTMMFVTFNPFRGFLSMKPLIYSP